MTKTDLVCADCGAVLDRTLPQQLLCPGGHELRRFRARIERVERRDGTPSVSIGQSVLIDLPTSAGPRMRLWLVCPECRLHYDPECMPDECRRCGKVFGQTSSDAEREILGAMLGVAP